jgi:hypothetical protein
VIAYCHASPSFNHREVDVVNGNIRSGGFWRAGLVAQRGRKSIQKLFSFHSLSEKKMHIIVVIISALASLLGVLNLLKALGIEIHPVIWMGRLVGSLFQKKHLSNAKGSNRTNTLDLTDDKSVVDSMLIATMIVVGVLIRERELSLEQKSAVISVFKNDFHMDDEQASGALNSALAEFGDDVRFQQFLNKVLNPTYGCFTREQAISLLAILRAITVLDGPRSAEQDSIINSIESKLS